MLNNAPNKVLVYGMPRTGTTILQEQLCQLFSLNNWSEPYTNNFVQTTDDIYAWTVSRLNSAIKLLTTNIIQTYPVDFDKLITTGNFDCIVISMCKNQVDACVSLYYAERIARQYHYHSVDNIGQQPFTLDLDFVTKCWKPEYQAFAKTLLYLDKNKIKYQTINYNDYVQNLPQEINGIKFSIADCETTMVNSNINYATLCQNYSDVKNLINEMIDTLC